MAGKTMIGGVAYDIKAGKTMIGGVAYDIKAGKTLVDGVAYDIKFGAAPFVIFQLGDTALRNGAITLSRSYSFDATRGLKLKPVYDDTDESWTDGYLNIGAAPKGSTGIDMTEYHTLHITAYRKEQRKSGSALVGLNKSKTVNDSFNKSQTVPDNTPEELTFDVSALTGTYYIRAYYNNTHSGIGADKGMFITSIYLD
nr:MAG TPA: hypothetical protein [Caudoviricetes sp.]